MPTLHDLPLRARKQARTRLALLEAALARLHGTRTLDDVSVKELCAEADISEASFFNYFPQKSDLLVYFVQLWSLDLAWQVQAQPATGSARDAIELIFAATARDAQERPRVLAEVLAHQARLATPPAPGELSLADRLTAFPERPGIEELPSLGLDGLLPKLLERAARDGELPAGVDRQAAFLGLAAIFFGVPTVLLRLAPEMIAPAYRQQLAIYWEGLRASRGKPPRPARLTRPARPARGAPRRGRARRSP
ncbi:MAG: TetR family transcriptional regulator [Kofleriaceae bacterium]